MARRKQPPVRGTQANEDADIDRRIAADFKDVGGKIIRKYDPSEALKKLNLGHLIKKK